MINNCQAAVFKRGSTFKFTLKLPDSVVDGTFQGWVPTAQIRKHRDDSTNGLIATIPVSWVNAQTARELRVNFNDTDAWPLGDADFDILLTAPDGTRLHSATMYFNIQRSVTK